MPSLKKAIIRYTEENYDRVVAPENVIVSSGAKQSLYNLLYTLLNPQDEVIILAPVLGQLSGDGQDGLRRAGDRHAGGRHVPPAHGGDRARGRPATPRPSSSTAPTTLPGVVYSDEFMADLVEFCERKDIYLISDDIYHKLVFDGRLPTSCYKFTTRDIESTQVIAINGVSKLYGMTGFRIGWVVANRKMVEVMTNVQAQTTSCASPVLQAAAEGALTGLQSVVEALRLTIENNRNVMLEQLNAFDGVHVVRPEGTFYCLPDFRAYNPNSDDLSRFLLRQGAGGHRAGQGVRHGRAPPPELLRHRQGHHRGRRAHQVGARSPLTQ